MALGVGVVVEVGVNVSMTSDVDVCIGIGVVVDVGVNVSMTSDVDVCMGGAVGLGRGPRTINGKNKGVPVIPAAIISA